MNLFRWNDNTCAGAVHCIFMFGLDMDRPLHCVHVFLLDESCKATLKATSAAGQSV